MSETNINEPSGQVQNTIPESLKEKLHVCESICRELEALSDHPECDVDSERSRLEAAFAAAPELPPEFAELLRKRFETALKNLEFASAENARRDAAFKELTAEIDALAAAGELATLKELEQLDKKCQRFAAENPVAAPQISAGLEKLAPMRERLVAEAEREKAVSAQADQLTEELTALTAAEDIAPLHDRKPAIEEAYAALGKVPAAAARRYAEAHKLAAVKLARHYETLDLARWESYTLKLDLCKKLEELSQLPDKEMIKVSKQLQEIREKWKTLGSVPKEKSEEINPRYLELTRSLQRKVDDFYSHRRQEQKQAAVEKQKLCDRAAELANSTDWAATANEFKEMQKTWKTIPGAGAAEHELFAKFRAQADIFFNARSAVLAERDRKFKETADAKEALIAAVEQLEPGNVRQAKNLRGQYQQLPPAGRDEHELRRRFDAAMNAFFAALKDDFARKEVKAQELAAELEQLAADPMAGHLRAREIREEFHKLSCRTTVALERAALDKFGKAFEAARKKEKEDMFLRLKPLALQIASAWADSEAALPDDAALEKFPRLRTAAKYIAALREGDPAAAEKLEKQIASARSEHQRIIAALEEISSARQQEPLSLAAELEAAILGNFASDKAAKKKQAADPRQLQQEYLNAGLLPLQELEESFQRFDAAFSAASVKK